jgi:hypothetical protein
MRETAAGDPHLAGGRILFDKSNVWRYVPDTLGPLTVGGALAAQSSFE